MLNSTTKNRINSCRDILVGKIPDPKGQIDQITNALVYKFMDDQDRMSRELGYDASFFIWDYEQYAWSKLFDNRLTNQEKANLYSEWLDKLSVADHLPELFKQIFKNARLPFKDPSTITMFLAEINGFSYHHSEELGNAFEYLLSVMGSQWDTGSFRTPRHIIEFLVDVVDPKRWETIYDPACGTAWFLIEAFNHIKSAWDLSVSDTATLWKNISWVDIDPGMAKIARVNLYLHGFKTPNIDENDTLSNEKLWWMKRDVILANPPFMTPKGGIRPHEKFSSKTSKSEVLFTDYIIEHLKLHGRAGIIVPEGIMFNGSNAYKDLRKKLVDGWYLWAVASLPSGVFNPYAGVKTSILFLDRERAKQNDNILFVKISADGYDLGAQRREINKNDLPKALEILNHYKENPNLGVSHPELVSRSLAHLVPKSKIAESGEYNLSGDRYVVSTSSVSTEFEMVELEKICDIFNWSTPKRTEIEYWENGTIPWFTIEDMRKQWRIIKNTEQKITDKWFAKSSVKLLPKQSVLLCCTASIGEYAYSEIELTTNQQFNGLVVKDREVLHPKYLFWSISRFKNELERMSWKATFWFVSVGTLKKMTIPLPPLEIQDQIVAELDRYQQIIDGARAVVENYKPTIKIDPEWEMVELGEVCDLQNGFAFKSDDYIDNSDTLNFRMSNIRPGWSVDIEYSKKFLPNSYSELYKEYILKDWDVVIAMTDMASDPKILAVPCVIKKVDYTLLLNQRVWRFIDIELQKIWKNYLQVILNQDFIRKTLSAMGGGWVQINLSKKDILKQRIPLPPLEIQQSIVV